MESSKNEEPNSEGEGVEGKDYSVLGSRLGPLLYYGHPLYL